MALTHDPVRQVNFLHQSLSDGKRVIGFLIAAGCPMSVRDTQNRPLIPDIKGLTDQISTRMLRGKLKNAFQAVLQHFAEDGNPSPTVEDILTHVRWMHRVVGKGTVRSLDQTSLQDLDDGICNAIAEIVNKRLPKNENGYGALAQWIFSIERAHAVEIFTLNYDLLIEQALESKGVAYFDGFVGSCNPFFDLRAVEREELPPRWTRLWKLHGSINWTHEDGRITRTRESVAANLIHPSHLKYDQSRRMPYVALIDRLKAFLSKQSVLIVTGYSFGDQHINSCIVEALQSNPRSAVFALTFGEISKYGIGIKLAQTHSNFNLLAKDEAIIGRRQAKWTGREESDVVAFRSALTFTKDGANNPCTSLELGDFACMGRFLSELTGEGQP